MTTRSLHRAAAALAGALTPVVVAAPAYAVHGQDTLSSGETTALLILVPLGVFLLVVFLTLLPRIRRPRYRPGRAWVGDPLWFGGPEDADAALRTTTVGTTAKGGASGNWR